MELSVNWEGGKRLMAETGRGVSFVFTDGQDPRGPSPMETLLAAVAACTALDVLSILEKKRQTVTSYRLEATGERPPEGQYPRRFERITVKHVLKGDDLDPVAVERAVQLSDEKYCSVSATIRLGATVDTQWEIVD